MFLKHLSISNFKNIEQVDIDCSPVLNCFVGDNGEGKTNLLDAVYYLSMCKSHFLTTDTQNIRDKEPYFMIKGDYHRKGEDEQVLCAMKRGGTKSFKLNGKEYERLSDHIGLMPLVIITPSDTSLINDGSEERRKFMNAVISQSDKEYLDSLLRYNHALLQRNKLLKNKQTPLDYGLLEVLNEQLSSYGQVVYEKRRELVTYFLPIFQEVYQIVSGEKETVGLSYRSDLEHDSMNNLLEQNMERDSFLQYTSVGVHRDDLVMELNGRPIRRTGSQGQQKTYLIAMKMAQFRIIKQHVGLSPILLLDDIFDKLDAGRVEKLISLVAKNGFGQIFLTDSNKNRLDHLLEKVGTDYKLFGVKAGAVSMNY